MSQITMPHVTDPSAPSSVTNSAPPAPTSIAHADSTVSIATTEPIEDYLLDAMDDPYCIVDILHIVTSVTSRDRYIRDGRAGDPHSRTLCAPCEGYRESNRLWAIKSSLFPTDVLSYPRELDTDTPR
ncbi:hypothetical protein B0H13DRAFT_2308175 [Mycena leptocephala]|nr:hypothetical protein B0H13DRAFT_2308175 [Mycena leptocephala]